MRKSSRMLPMLVLAIGCTSGQLRLCTVRQSKSLADLQHQLVLNNLASFACNPDAIPSQVNLKTGTTQITDTGNSGASLVKAWAATLAGTRSIVEQWDTSPVTDDTTLKLLRLAYRRALGAEEDLYSARLINGLAHQLKKQTGAGDDVRTLNEAKDVLSRPRYSAADGNKLNWDENVCKMQMSNWIKYWQCINNYIISANDPKIVLDGEYLTEKNVVRTPIDHDGNPLASVDFKQQDQCKCPCCKVATPLAAELRRQVMEVNNDLLAIHPGWFGVGKKKDVPKCACYVGCHKECGHECYVWVLPEGRKAFEDFTITILGFASLIQPLNVTINPGVRYSPGAVGGVAGTR